MRKWQPANLDEVFGEYWALKKQRISFLRDFVHNAKLLAFTPRTDKQRAEFAVKAGELVLEHIPHVGYEEVLGAILLEIVVKAVIRAERDYLQRGFRCIKRRYQLVREREIRAYRAGKRLYEFPESKLLSNLAQGLMCLRLAAMKARWPALESRLGLLCVRTLYACKDARTRTVASTLKDVLKSRLKQGVRKMDRVARRCWRVEGLRILDSLLAYDSGSAPKGNSAIRNLRMLLSKHLSLRFRDIISAIKRQSSVSKLRNILTFKVYERKAALFRRLQPLNGKQLSNRQFLTLNRALKLLPGLGRPYIKAIADGKLAPLQVARSVGRNAAMRLVLEYAIRKIAPKQQKFLLFEQQLALWRLKMWPDTARKGRNIGKILAITKETVVGYYQRIALRGLLKQWESPMLTNLRKVTCFCYSANRANRRKAKMWKKAAIVMWKRGTKGVAKNEKLGKIKEKAAAIIGNIENRAILALFRTLKAKTNRRFTKSQSKLFQKLLFPQVLRHLKGIISSRKTAKNIELLVPTTIPGLFRVRKALQRFALFKSYQKLLKLSRSKSKISQNNTAKVHFSILKAINSLQSIVNRRYILGIRKLKENALLSRTQLRKVSAIGRIWRIKGMRWTRVEKRLTRMILLLKFNRKVAITKAIAHWKGQNQANNCRKIVANNVGKMLKSLIFAAKKAGFNGLRSFSNKRKAVAQWHATLKYTEIVQNGIAMKGFYKKLLAVLKESRSLTVELAKVLPIAKKAVQRRVMQKWKLRAKGKTGYEKKTEKRLNAVRRIVGIALNLKLKIALRKVTAKANVRRKLPIAVGKVMGKRIDIVRADALQYIKTHRRIYTHSITQKATSALRTLSLLRLALQRLTHSNLSSLYFLYRESVARRQRACKRLAASLKRLCKTIYAGCFGRLEVETAKNYYAVQGTAKRWEVSLSTDKCRIYASFDLLAEVPKKVKIALLKETLETMKEDFDDYRQQTAEKHRKLSAFQRILTTHRVAIDHPSLRKSFSLWHQSTFFRRSVTFGSVEKLKSAISAIRRLATYRLSYQSFAAIQNTAALQDISHGVLLCRKVTYRSGVKSLSKSVR